jgi:hypothetical protein
MNFIKTCTKFENTIQFWNGGYSTDDCEVLVDMVLVFILRKNIK